MSNDLPEPRVVPTPAFSPRTNLLAAATIMAGVLGLFVGLGKPPSPTGLASGGVDPQSPMIAATR